MLTFHRFKLEEHPNCAHDFLQIQDGYNMAAHTIGRYCGSELPNGGTINTTHFVASLYFHADASVNRDGFALSWISVNPSQPLLFHFRLIRPSGTAARFTKYLKLCLKIDRKSVASSPLMIFYDLSHNYRYYVLTVQLSGELAALSDWERSGE